MLSFLNIKLPSEIEILILDYLLFQDLCSLESINLASAVTIPELYKILFKKKYQHFPIDEFVTWFNRHFPAKVTALPWSKKYYQQCLLDSGLDWVVTHQLESISFLKSKHRNTGIIQIIKPLSELNMYVTQDLFLLQNNQNLIEMINESIIRGALANLSTGLYLSRSGITHLPESLFEKKDLKEYWLQIKTLTLQVNHLTYLPSWIVKLSNLECLICEHNKIKYLPNNMGDFKKLKELHVQDNQLIYLPLSITNASKLETLYLDKNSISELPDDFDKLQCLRYLSFESNQFRKFPEKIHKIKSLEILIFNQNFIKEIPKELDQLKKLQLLQGNNNELIELPESIGKLPLIRGIFFSHNFLKKLPTGFYEFKTAAIETLKNQKTPVTLNDIDNIQKRTLILNLIN